jgi:phosphonoacetaldehyde hydrolase
MKLLNSLVPPQAPAADRLQALVLDWAGTTVDFGSVAPARTIQRLFSMRQVEITGEEARRDMGLAKKEHIRSILGMQRVRNAWAQIHGAVPGDTEVDALYADFIPMQISCLREYSAVIPGVPEAVAQFRARGLKIGSTTGYTREMVDRILGPSAEAGYAPDCSLTPGEAGSGRPWPFMLYECAVRLQIFPMSAIAKAGDTPADMQEALNAGAWAIGIAGTGNRIGRTREEFLSLPRAEQEALLIESRGELAQAGAHFVVDSVAELGPALDAIDALLAQPHVAEAIHAG